MSKKPVTEESILSVIAEELSLDSGEQVHRSDDLRDDLGADSLDLVTLEIALEELLDEEGGIELDCEDWETVGDVVDDVLARVPLRG